MPETMDAEEDEWCGIELPTNTVENIAVATHTPITARDVRTEPQSTTKNRPARRIGEDRHDA